MQTEVTSESLGGIREALAEGGDLQKYQRLQSLLDHKVVDDEVLLFMAQSALNAHLWREARSKIDLIIEKSHSFILSFDVRT